MTGVGPVVWVVAVADADLPDAADLARRVAARGGVLVHLTGHPDIITARLRLRDGSSAPLADRVRAIIGAYHDTFALLDGTAPIITRDPAPGYGPGHMDSTARP